MDQQYTDPCSPNWFGRFYHKVNDVHEIWKIENFHHISIFQSLGCFVNEIWKIENNHQISIFHSVGCFVTLIKKVNITVITTLETDWPQEATLSVVINSYNGNWIQNVGQIVPL